MAGQENPRDLQLRFLEKMRLLLKPSGFLCVGIENRIGAEVIRGAVDHSGWPYTSLMPRRVADVWCRYKQRRYRSGANLGYRTYTYSLSGYRKLFREAGFASTAAFHAWDGYNKPSLLLPLKSPKPLIHFAAGRHLKRSDWAGRFRKLAMKTAAKTSVWSKLASEFVFLVYKT
jgi:hypothetical protein